MAATNTKARDTLAKLRIRRDETSPPSRVRRVTLTMAIIMLLLVVAAGGLLLAEQRRWMAGGWLSLPDAMKRRVEVRVVAVTVETGRTGDATVVATGYLESRRQAKIGARAPGRIEYVYVEEGSRVKDNQLLAVLEHADLDASLAAAQAVLKRGQAEVVEHEVEIARTKSEFERAKKLRPSAAMSIAEYDNARFLYDAAVARRDSLAAAVVLAEARVREAEQRREEMYIRASFDGTVISKDAEVGESILPGGMGEASGRGSVVTIADLDHMEVECDVKEDYIARVKAEMSAEVAVDAVPDRRYQGRVRKIIPMGDRARATIKVQVEILEVDDHLFPEMSATVYFLPDDAASSGSEQRRLFCPSQAVVEEHGETVVFTVDETDRVRRIPVETAAPRDGRVEVVKGLTGNELVVAEPPQELSPGVLVRVVE